MSPHHKLNGKIEAITIMLVMIGLGLPTAHCAAKSNGGHELEYEEWIRSEFASQPWAVEAGLKVLNTLSRKRNRLGPVLIHFAGASIGHKTCLAWSMAAEYLNRLEPAPMLMPAQQEMCAQMQALSMDDVGNIEGDLEKLCSWPCPERVVVIDGIGEATLPRLEQLLQRLTEEGQRGAGVCPQHPALSLSRWVFFLISELGHDELQCQLELSANQTERDVANAVKHAVRLSPGLEAVYGDKRATKSKVWSHGLKNLVPFACLGKGAVDTSDCAGDHRPIALRARKERKRPRPVGAASESSEDAHGLRAGSSSLLSAGLSSLLSAGSSSLPSGVSEDAHGLRAGTRTERRAVQLAVEEQWALIDACVDQWEGGEGKQVVRDWTLERLPEKFRGQVLAVKRATNRLKSRQQGWGRRTKPLVMVFWGPSGTGKTELARQIAAAIHGEPPEVLLANKKFVSLPMAQYQDKMSTATLVGPPVGIEGLGQLTGALLQEPAAVVLLDEFEKAHPEAISDVLLAAFDGSGGLKDTKLNVHVPTNDATFIINTNIGASIVLERSGELHELRHDPSDKDGVVLEIDKGLKAMLKQADARLSPFGKPEFRGRVDAWIPFLPYQHTHKCAVVEQALASRILSYYKHDVAAERRLLVGWDRCLVMCLCACGCLWMRMCTCVWSKDVRRELIRGRCALGLRWRRWPRITAAPMGTKASGRCCSLSIACTTCSVRLGSAAPSRRPPACSSPTMAWVPSLSFRLLLVELCPASPRAQVDPMQSRQERVSPRPRPPPLV
jgi:hypothetical protein